MKPVSLLTRIMTIAFFGLLLSGCGFHLRGIVDVPKWLNHVALISKINDKQLTSILESQLESYHIDVTDDPATANYWLIIERLNLHQQIISVGASTNPRQYNLILSLEFSLQTHRGKIIPVTGKVSATRQLTINNDRILGSTDEENILINEMKQDVAVQMINRLGKIHKPGLDQH